MTKNEIHQLFLSFRSRYRSSGRPVRVNFRKLVPELNGCDRFTHLIHAYPAKLLNIIPYFFFQTEDFCPNNGLVLDPFCGTGTVLLEANLSGRNALGADANPLARLITAVKTTYIPHDRLLKEIDALVENAKKSKSKLTWKTEIIDYWFSQNVISQLEKIRVTIDEVKNLSDRNFFLLCFSSLIKKISFADPSISVPVKLNPERFDAYPIRKKEAQERLLSLENVDVYEKFKGVCLQNADRISTLKSCKRNNVKSKVISKDARRLTKLLRGKQLLENESVDLVLTSPPYAGAQKYIRSSWLNLFWLNGVSSKDIQELNNQNIGKEDYIKADVDNHVKTFIPAVDRILNRLYEEGKNVRACIVGNYINEMKKALDESIRVLKKNGYLIMVIGNNTVCGKPFNTQQYLTSYMQEKGMSLQFKLIDDIKSYGLMTKRNKTASRISREWVLVLRKDA